MLYEVDWAEDGTYVPGEYYSPEKFFNDGLKNSTEFDLKLGYFSSAAISVLAEGFASFISKGGYMRLIINHIVSPKDKYDIFFIFINLSYYLICDFFPSYILMRSGYVFNNCKY